MKLVNKLFGKKGKPEELIKTEKKFTLNELYGGLRTSEGRANFILGLDYRILDLDSSYFKEVEQFLGEQKKYESIARIEFLIGNKNLAKKYLYKEFEKREKLGNNNPSLILKKVGDVKKVIEYEFKNKNFYSAAYYAKENGLETLSQMIAQEGLKNCIDDIKKSFKHKIVERGDPSYAFKEASYLQGFLPIVPEVREILELEEGMFSHKFARGLEEKGEFGFLGEFYENKKKFGLAAEMMTKLGNKKKFIMLKKSELLQKEDEFKIKKIRKINRRDDLGYLYHLAKDAGEKDKASFYAQRIFEEIENHEDWWDGVYNFIDKNPEFMDKYKFYYSKLMEAYVSGKYEPTSYYAFQEPVDYYEKKGELEKAVLVHEQMNVFEEGAEYALKKGFADLAEIYKQISKIFKQLKNFNFEFKFDKI